jgi:hypothetical protein
MGIEQKPEPKEKSLHEIALDRAQIMGMTREDAIEAMRQQAKQSASNPSENAASQQAHQDAIDQAAGK